LLVISKYLSMSIILSRVWVTTDGVRICERIYWLLIHRTTSNYSATASLHNSQITTAPAKPFLACCVFTSCSLATASNSGDSSASRSQVLASQTPIQNWLGRPNCPPYNSLTRTTQTHPVSNSTSVVARWFFAAGTCLLSRCPETALVYLPISRLLDNNGSKRYNIYWWINRRVIYGRRCWKWKLTNFPAEFSTWIPKSQCIVITSWLTTAITEDQGSKQNSSSRAPIAHAESFCYNNLLARNKNYSW
jgi:hypothetical protein